MEYSQDIFPQNSLNEDPNLRGEVPMIHQLVKINPGALVTGTVDVEVASKIGTGLGEVLGILPLTQEEGAEVFGCSVVASSSAGYVTVTVSSDDGTSTTNLSAFYAYLVGRIYPNNPA